MNTEINGVGVTKDYLRENKIRRVKELCCIWSVLIIPLIMLAIFWVYGTIQSIPIAFEHRNELTGEVSYDFYNFRYLFGDFTTTGRTSGIPSGFWGRKSQRCI